MSNYIYFDLEPHKGRNHKMNDDQCALNYSKNNHCLTINRKVSDYLLYAGFDKCRIRYDTDTDTACLVFNKKVGVQITANGKKDKNVTIRSKLFIEKIAELLNINLDVNKRMVLYLGNDESEDDHSAIYEIYKFKI